MRRGADKTLRWMSTLFPTNAYAMEAEMGLSGYEDFVYAALHADDRTPDPVAYWQKLRRQQRIVDRIEGHDQVFLQVRMSIFPYRSRGALSAIPAGSTTSGWEIYTGPVEDSANGWVHIRTRYLPGTDVRHRIDF